MPPRKKKLNKRNKSLRHSPTQKRTVETDLSKADFEKKFIIVPDVQLSGSTNSDSFKHTGTSQNSSEQKNLQLTVTHDDNVDMKMLYGIDPETYADTIERNIVTRLKCPLCCLGFEFDGNCMSVIPLQTHIVSKHIRNRLDCPICFKKFSNTSTISKHIMEHVNCKQYPCPICREKFVTRTELIPHMISHTSALGLNDDPSTANIYSCNFCSVNFANKQYYDNHMESHRFKGVRDADDKPFCNICQVHFNDKRQLSQHMKVHQLGKAETSRPKNAKSSANPKQNIAQNLLHECDVCGKIFSDSMFLVCHMNYHALDGSSSTIKGTALPQQSVDTHFVKSSNTAQSSSNKSQQSVQSTKPEPSSSRYQTTYGKPKQDIHTSLGSMQVDRNTLVTADKNNDGKLTCDICYLSFDKEHSVFFMEHLKSHKTAHQNLTY